MIKYQIKAKQRIQKQMKRKKAEKGVGSERHSQTDKRTSYVLTQQDLKSPSWHFSLFLVLVQIFSLRILILFLIKKGLPFRK